MSFAVSLGQQWIANPVVTYHAGPGIEEPTQVAFPGGMLANTHKLTGNVLHQGDNIMLGGHDCGPLIRHLVYLKDAPPPASAAWSFLCTFSSERKCGYSSSLVKMNGDGTGLSGAAGNGAWLTQCGDIPLPSFVINGSSTVFVGASADDLSAGWYNYCVDVLFGAVAMAEGGDPMEGISGVGGPSSTGFAKSIIKAGINYYFKGKGTVEVGGGVSWSGGGGGKTFVEVERDKKNGKFIPNKIVDGYETSDGLGGNKHEHKKVYEIDPEGNVKQSTEDSTTSTDLKGRQTTRTTTEAEDGTTTTTTTTRQPRSEWSDTPYWESTKHEQRDKPL